MGGGLQPIPDWRRYNDWQKYPELVEHQRKLGKLGLKDPWVRNLVFMSNNEKHFGYKGVLSTAWRIMSTGWKTGVLAAVAFISVEETYTYVKYGHTSWNAPHH